MSDDASTPDQGAAPAPAAPAAGRRRAAWLLAGLAAAAALAFGLGRTPGPAGDAAATPGPLATAHAAAPAPTETAAAAEGSAPADRPPGGGIRPDDLLAAAAGTASPTDARLLRIYGLIATGRAQEALDAAARLTADYPQFGLAQLVYADLLTTLTRPAEGFGASAAAQRAEAAERLKELVAEARARVGSAQRPAAGLVPAQFVRIDPSVQHAVAVDVSRSRLYVFENTPQGLVLKRDYYSSVGKLGMAKQVEGDLRTPLGVYFVTGRVPEARLRQPALKDLYGAAALVLNYPNQYDQLRGRTGSGIWLHGVASNLFSRAPLATDGCVALANPDLLEMATFIERQETPILIAERLEWVRPEAAQQRQAGFLRAFDAWKAARSAADAGAQQRFYADQRTVVSTVPEIAARSTERQRALMPVAFTPAAPNASIDAVTVLAWRDDRDVVVVTFTETTPGGNRPRLKRQYWLEQDGQWQVVFEGSLGQA
ncbi:L,D-transpeptidase family protein [Piscinibacter sakaiensis]|uniref:ErfK/YbiS/YcfS/YnhG family protein n=1 Tax=Piscinibacter sakaiensis TaxID=1547922 RepID=A0A0K8P0I3_PISS1|nr:L,D-transpeptidase family protein [Piscinibacter sakaiensis]GAP35665.1 ErfK/YbiS/YcfS/YnhG family protein [Piscinibacter sakaiensis]